MERGYFIQIVNDLHQLSRGLEGRHLLVKLSSPDNLAQLVRELGRQLVQPEKRRYEGGIRGHRDGDVAGACSRGEGNLSEKRKEVSGGGRPRCVTVLEKHEGYKRRRPSVVINRSLAIWVVARLSQRLGGNVKVP